ncbi:MAG: isoleucine--tRNA ligase [Patescibacteria group bacterium]|nr:isoleucine--tRNA ligase [Patescibacteria group bacterium]
MFNLPTKEQEILKLWQENNIFEKSLAKDAPKGDFVFYDGPPFATGTPHYGHIVASLMKDIVPRYWTMKGFRVERRWGWDCHGLPIENIVEEEMGIKSKKDIEKIGIEKFNEACHSKVLMYAEEWRKVVARMGRWVDMDNDYKTMDKDYMESIWWVFKELWNKDLIYEGYKSMHICPRCETTLSQSEVAEGYRDTKDISVTVKFELVDEPGTFVLAWTTTPWTLMGNVALAVGKDVEYFRFKGKNKKTGEEIIYIVAKDLAAKIFDVKDGRIANRFIYDDFEFEWNGAYSGNTLAHKFKKYKPLFDYYQDKNLENKENLYTIQTADFVTTEDGTGVVHIAPAFGEDDLNLGRAKKLPFIQHVGMDGRIKDEVKDFAGLEVKPKDDPTATDKKIIEFLQKKNLVFATEEYTHSYPFCWRCDSPLLNYATSSLFVKVEEIKKQALKTAERINWVPAHLKEGRFGQWLEGARDWSISRQRFWGSVVPLWVCDKCGEKKVMGGVEELEKISGKKVEDLHKHYIDKITFKCEKHDGIMKRVPDVLDCWFESGSMPYAQMHYPFENKEKFEANFPAEFIAEGVDQTRAWFYYMHILANGLKKTNAFKNVIANGIVLAEDGKKMSKKLRNYPDPMDLMEKSGADTMRYYLCASQVMKADNLCFSEKDMKEQTRFFNTLFNVLSFYQMYENQFSGTELFQADAKPKNILDKWILARLHETIKKMTEKLDAYDLHAVRELPLFIDELSTWYVRRSRDRFKGDDEKDKNQAIFTLGKVLFELSKLLAPFTPFTAEHLYQELGKNCGSLKESVHLEDWTEYNKKLIDQKVLDYMSVTHQVVELGLAKRAEVGIKVRQPLQKLTINNQQLTIEYTDLIKDELNVKGVVCEKGSGELAVELDTELTDELKEEGILRELTRTINGLRKDAKLTIDDFIKLEYNTTDEQISRVFEKYSDDLKKSILAKEISKIEEDLEKVKINEAEIGLKITKI